MKKIIIWIYNFVKMMNRDNIFVYSAQASFFIIISALPAAMLFLSLLRFLLPLSDIKILEIAKSFTPNILLPIIQAILKEVLDKTSPSILSGAILSSLWTASRGVLAIERGVKSVLGKRVERGFVLNAAFSILYTILFMLIISAVLVFFAFGAAIMRNFSSHSELISVIFGRSSAVKWIISISLISFLFAVIYSAFSSQKTRFFMHLPGAVFTALGWLIFSTLYSFYIENFANYSYVYGSLTAVILMMLWVYFCMIIFLTGAELNKVVSTKK